MAINNNLKLNVCSHLQETKMPRGDRSSKSELGPVPWYKVRLLFSSCIAVLYLDLKISAWRKHDFLS